VQHIRVLNWDHCLKRRGEDTHGKQIAQVVSAKVSGHTGESAAQVVSPDGGALCTIESCATGVHVLHWDHRLRGGRGQGQRHRRKPAAQVASQDGGRAIGAGHGVGRVRHVCLQRPHLKGGKGLETGEVDIPECEGAIFRLGSLKVREGQSASVIVSVCHCVNVSVSVSMCHCVPHLQ